MSESTFQTDATQFKVQATKLTLHAIRGFQHIEVGLEDYLTVFIAQNGAGKSTMLDALWEGIQVISQEVFAEKPNETSLEMGKKDVKNGLSAASIQTSFLLKYRLPDEEDTDEENTDEEQDASDAILVEGERPFIDYIAGLDIEFALNAQKETKDTSIREEPGEDHVNIIHEYIQGLYKVEKDNTPVFKYYRYGDSDMFQAENTKWEQLKDWIDLRHKVAAQNKGR